MSCSGAAERSRSGVDRRDIIGMRLERDEHKKRPQLVGRRIAYEGLRYEYQGPVRSLAGRLLRPCPDWAGRAKTGVPLPYENGQVGRDVAQAAAPRAQKDGILVQGNNRIAISEAGGASPRSSCVDRSYGATSSKCSTVGNGS